MNKQFKLIYNMDYHRLCQMPKTLIIVLQTILSKSIVQHFLLQVTNQLCVLKITPKGEILVML